MQNKNYSKTEEVVLNDVFGRRVFVCNNEMIKSFITTQTPKTTMKVRGSIVAKLYDTFVVLYRNNTPFLIEAHTNPQKWKKEINSTEENTLLFLAYVDELYKKINDTPSFPKGKQ